MKDFAGIARGEFDSEVLLSYQLWLMLVVLTVLSGLLDAAAQMPNFVHL